MENPFEEQQNQFQRPTFLLVFLPLSVVVGELYPIYFLYLQPD